MPKKTDSALGKSIKNKLKNQRLPQTHHQIAQAKFYQPDGQAKMINKLKSTLHQDTLQEYIQVIQLVDKKFQATKGVKLGELKGQTVLKTIVTEQVAQPAFKRELKSLRIPRRPKWTRQMSREELVSRQNEAFLEWRRMLAQYEQVHYQSKLTPFQKNIEVWRQLWRVVEECQILVQIVDARDPLFFRCQDLQMYVKEVNSDKMNILLLNKSDLIQEQVRKQWVKYFKERKIDCIFYSAKSESQRSPQLKQLPQILNNPGDIIPPELKEQKKLDEQIKQEVPIQPLLFSHELVSRDGLLNFFKCQFKDSKRKVIGMVGYPNVGKSSVINSLLGFKKAPVGSLPGKTKHMQLLKLEHQLLLCDCPGLVFPSAGSSFAQLVLNGVIGIDNLKDYISPMALMVTRIPKIFFQCKYALEIKENTVEGLLQAYGKTKGLYTGRGLPNQAFASRYILKDYVQGRIVWASLPPQSQLKPVVTISQKQKLQKLLKRQKEGQKDSEVVVKQIDLREQEIDAEFFVDAEKITWSQDDILDLLQGLTVHNFKANKQVKRQIKFGMRRGEEVQGLMRRVMQGQTGKRRKQEIRVK